MSRQLNKIVNYDNKSERIVSLQLKYVSRRNFKSNIIVNHWLVNVKKTFAKKKKRIIIFFGKNTLIKKYPSFHCAGNMTS